MARAYDSASADRQYSLLIMRFIIASLLYFVVLSSYAQRGISLQWQPELSFNIKTAGRWQFNLRAVGFNTFANPSPQGTTGNYRFNHAEFLVFATYGLSVSSAFSVGYLYRIREPFEGATGYEHRLMQQVNFLSNFGRFRVGNRVRSEQRIRNNGFSQRFRYRVSVDFPLSGDVLDPGEMYGVVSEELFWSLNGGGAPDNGESRLTVGPGFFFNRELKLELLLQYRLTNIVFREKEPVGNGLVVLSTLLYNL